jgi:hypothetical protein
VLSVLNYQVPLSQCLSFNLIGCPPLSVCLVSPKLSGAIPSVCVSPKLSAAIPKMFVTYEKNPDVKSWSIARYIEFGNKHLRTKM